MKENSDGCLICNNMQLKNEVWLQCNICKKWAYQECTVYDGVGFYECDFCCQCSFLKT